MTNLHAGIYVDSQDPSDVGWAWRVVTVDEDGIQQVRACAPEAPAELYVSASERWDYSDGGEGSYEWSGERG